MLFYLWNFIKNIVFFFYFFILPFVLIIFNKFNQKLSFFKKYITSTSRSIIYVIGFIE